MRLEIKGVLRLTMLLVLQVLVGLSNLDLIVKFIIIGLSDLVIAVDLAAFWIGKHIGGGQLLFSLLPLSIKIFFRIPTWLIVVLVIGMEILELALFHILHEDFLWVRVFDVHLHGL